MATTPPAPGDPDPALPPFRAAQPSVSVRPTPARSLSPALPPSWLLYPGYACMIAGAVMVGVLRRDSEWVGVALFLIVVGGLPCLMALGRRVRGRTRSGKTAGSGVLPPGWRITVATLLWLTLALIALTLSGAAWLVTHPSTGWEKMAPFFLVLVAGASCPWPAAVAFLIQLCRGQWLPRLTFATACAVLGPIGLFFLLQAVRSLMG